MMAAVRGYASGKVQGVYFRRHVQLAAESLGLAGYAKNLADGRVEIVLCGDAAVVEKAQAAVAEGPPRSRVDDVRWQTIDPPRLSGFEVL